MIACFTTVTYAQDVIIDKPIKSIVVKKDKNGNEYVRFMIDDKNTLNGISYSKETSVMAFGDQVPKAKTFKKGQTLKAVVNKGQYKGRTSYTIIEIVS
jgi:cAMP phosphodiesterase